MTLLESALLLLAGFGHLVLWTAGLNRLHALALDRRLIDGAALAVWTAMFVVPCLILWVYEPARPITEQKWLLAYGAICVAMAVYGLLNFADRVINRHDRHPVLLENHTSTVDMVAALGHRPVADRKTDLLTRIPGNEVLLLKLQQKTVFAPRLLPDLDGLTIAHLSDLHLTGSLTRRWLEEVVDLTLDMEPDLVAITGDLFDNAKCLDWIPRTFGRLRARHGVFFVLGNHDQRVDPRRIRQLLVDAGLIDLGGTWREVPIGRRSIVVAGNELPWFAPAAEMENCPTRRHGERLFRILLSHSPDQIQWARTRDFDLMLAGHTHGGQIRLPLVGPVVTPSRKGVRYAAGTYHRSPTTLHVSRGISSEFPLRFNCPPELAIIELHSFVGAKTPELCANLHTAPA